MGRAAVALIVGLWVIPISMLVNRIVPETYMDEIFHIPQAQEYCKGNFKSWDPMITTPPGMLLLGRVLSFSDFCSAAILRSINGVLAVICSVLVYEIIIQLRPELDRKNAILYSVVLSLYPLHWFFTHLYYTDLASLTVFLAMYLTSLKKKYFCSALVRDSLKLYVGVHRHIYKNALPRVLLSFPGGNGCLFSSCSLGPWQIDR